MFNFSYSACFLVFVSCSGLCTGAAPGDISKEMCYKYSKYISDSSDCSSVKESLDVGNYFAKEGEFPHMVILGYNAKDGAFQLLCAASLISDQYVLTSAHCLRRKEGGPVVARLGLTNLNETSHLQEIKLSEIIVHPQFVPPSVYNDIGLVKLEKKVDIGTYVRPACLFTEKEVVENHVINTAWGATRYAGEFSDEVQKVVLEHYSQKDCNATYVKDISRRLKQGVTYDIMICAGTKTIITHQPQSGGPLQIPHKDDGNSACLYDIVGVASVGKPSLKPNLPGIYTRVSAYINWIEDNVWK